MRIKFTDGNELIFSEKLKTCSNCQKPMIASYTSLPEGILRDAANMGIERESYHDFGVCNSCLRAGGFKRECSLCNQEREFPREFSFEITNYPKYPECDTDYYYMCHNCVKDNPGEVMNFLVRADETKDLR